MIRNNISNHSDFYFYFLNILNKHECNGAEDSTPVGNRVKGGDLEGKVQRGGSSLDCVKK